MSKSKKPRKPYRQKPARFPTLLLHLLPDLTEEEHAELGLHYRVPFDAICRGETSVDGWRQARDALQIGFIMASGFKDHWYLRACLQLGIVALDAGALTCSQGQIPPAHIIEPARKAFDLVDDLRKELTRSELLSALYAADNRRLTGIMPYDPDAVRIVYPKDMSTWEDIQAEPALALINGLPRTGCLVYDTSREGLTWVAPVEKITAVVTEPLLVLLATPTKRKKKTEKEVTDETATSAQAGDC